ncbi:MAG TPA: serine/threonine-protein kinase [Thermoanaerobaculia bacterium]|nr:serine/threonine-protein kinase [Thermoanaerobaculia bacterium]
MEAKTAVPSPEDQTSNSPPEAPTVAEPTRFGSRRRVPLEVGPFRLVELLGEGGMGSVYRAEQDLPRRQVAVKLILAHRFDEARLRRFEAERQALARMSHPYIAQVYAAGTSADGQPYLAMELIAGEPLTRYCDGHRLPLSERIELVIAVCQGVQHAHQKAVLHGDLKPSNVLVTEIDGRAVPKIIDFGIARGLDEPLAPGTTLDPGVLGTPSYICPEALTSGETRGLDTRADVYALGVVLYELLTGVQPFGGSGVEVLQRVAAGDFEPPSAAVAKLAPAERARLAGLRRVDARSLARALRGDLDAIVLRAMARDRDARYASAAELAADLRRHLDEQPVLATPAGMAYRVRKFVRRHRAAVAGATLTAIALVAGFVARSLEARRAGQEAAAAREVTDFMVGLFQTPDPGGGLRPDATAREILDRGARRIRGELAGQPLTRARLLDTIGNVYRSLGLYPSAIDLLSQALAERRRLLGPDHPDVGETEYHLATSYRELGRYAEAEPFARRANAIAERSGNLRTRAGCLVELATIAGRRGRRDEAEKNLQSALGLFERALGPDSERVSAALNNLGNLYYDERRFPEAEKCHLRAIAIKEKTLGPNHLYLAQSLNNLANVYSAMGRFDDAQGLHARALKIKRQALPADHPEIGISLLNLGDVASRRGDLATAVARYREALGFWERTQAADYLPAAYTRASLASALATLGQAKEADHLYQSALAVLAAKLPPAHPNLTEVRAEYARFLRAAGQPPQAPHQR